MRSPPRLEIEAASRSTGGVPLAACAPVSRIHGQYAAPGIQRNTTRILFALLAVHIGLVAWGAWRHSPTFDEAAHLGAGLSHWRLGRFDAYRVNPPLVRMIAAVPLVLLDADAGIPWDGFPSDPGLRPEYYLGHKFIAARGSGSLWWLTVARWTCIPFSVLGAWICFCWARDLYGERSALLAAALWCFCPTLIGNAELMTPDVGGAGAGIGRRVHVLAMAECARSGPGDRCRDRHGTCGVIEDDVDRALPAVAGALVGVESFGFCRLSLRESFGLFHFWVRY